MTLVSQIITDAYRATNLIAVGKEPNIPQAAEGLRYLERLIGSVYGNEAGEDLKDWPLGNFGRNVNFVIPAPAALIYPTINSRLLALSTGALTVYLPVNPSDGSRIAISDPFSRLSVYPVTLDANGRAVEGATSLVLNTNALNRVWFYRSDLGNWVRITGITATDEMPFPTEFDDFFVFMLAVRINPAYGKTIPPEISALLKRAKNNFVNQYLQSAPLEQNTDLAFPTRQSYNNGWGYPGYDSNAAWNRGGFPS